MIHSQDKELADMEVVLAEVSRSRGYRLEGLTPRYTVSSRLYTPSSYLSPSLPRLYPFLYPPPSYHPLYPTEVLAKQVGVRPVVSSHRVVCALSRIYSAPFIREIIARDR